MRPGSIFDPNCSNYSWLSDSPPHQWGWPGSLFVTCLRRDGGFLCFVCMNALVIQGTVTHAVGTLAGCSWRRCTWWIHIWTWLLGSPGTPPALAPPQEHHSHLCVTHNSVPFPSLPGTWRAVPKRGLRVDGGEREDAAGCQASLQPSVWSLMDRYRWSIGTEQMWSETPDAGEHSVCLTALGACSPSSSCAHLEGGRWHKVEHLAHLWAGRGGTEGTLHPKTYTQRRVSPLCLRQRRGAGNLLPRLLPHCSLTW